MSGRVWPLKRVSKAGLGKWKRPKDLSDIMLDASCDQEQAHEEMDVRSMQYTMVIGALVDELARLDELLLVYEDGHESLSTTHAVK